MRVRVWDRKLLASVTYGVRWYVRVYLFLHFHPSLLHLPQGPCSPQRTLDAMLSTPSSDARAQVITRVDLVSSPAATLLLSYLPTTKSRPRPSPRQCWLQAPV